MKRSEIVNLVIREVQQETEYIRKDVDRLRKDLDELFEYLKLDVDRSVVRITKRSDEAPF